MHAHTHTHTHTHKLHKRIAAFITSTALLLSPIAISNITGRSILSEPEAKAASTSGFINEKREAAKAEALASFKFTDTGLVPWNGSYANTGCYNSSTSTYEVRTPQDFAYAAANAGSGSKIILYNDIDMGGSSGRNFSNIHDWNGVFFDGQGHTVYNLYCETGNATVGVCHYITSCTLRNVTFDSSKLIGINDSVIFVGIFPKFSGAGSDVDNIYITNGLFYNKNSTEQGGIVAPLGWPGSNWCSTIDNSGSTNCVSIGNAHIGGFVSGYDNGIYRDCFSDGNLVISYGGHGGAFGACQDQRAEFYRCWSNSTIYGNSDVGGFTSGCDGRGVIYEDCWSSGVVEGEKNIGGFVGMTYYYTSSERDWVARNCYSTCMVGMNYEGESLGGFAGSSQPYVGGKHKKIILENCYAAGEVGSIDTDIATTRSIGGFIGTIAPDKTYQVSNCYYDMQNTAMKNKAIGNVDPLGMTRDSTGVYTTISNGIRGITTKKMTGNSNLFPSGYIYENGLYPQLSCMAQHSNIKFRAQSAASCSTVFCDDWADISQTGFDTVRDTMRNYSFSSTASFSSNSQFASAQVTTPNVSSLTWRKDGNISPIDGVTPVITLAEHPYYTTALSPGIEWVETKLTYTNNGQSSTGSRRLRLIPTSLIETGGDKRVDIFYDGDNNETDPYDHKEGFATTYLDAATLQSYLTSGTVHNESLMTFENVINQQYNSGNISGTINLPFNSKVTNLSVSAKMTYQDGTPANIDYLFDKLNGVRSFEPEDCGIYKIVYKSSLSDGRYLSIGKKLIVVGPWSVIYHYGYDGLIAGERITPESIFAIQSNLMSFEGFELDAIGEPPTRDGWSFAYWSLDPEGTQPVNQSWFDNYEGKHGFLTENTDIYAQWNKVESEATYTLDIDPDIGQYGNRQLGEHVTLDGHEGDTVLIESSLPPDRYSFDCWNIATGSGSIVRSGDDNYWLYTFGSSDASIQARYYQSVFSIKWVDGFTGTVISDDDVQLNAAATPPSTPIHQWYKFTGYSIDESQWQDITQDMEIVLNYEYDRVDFPATGEGGIAFLLIAGGIFIATSLASIFVWCRKNPCSK